MNKYKVEISKRGAPFYPANQQAYSHPEDADRVAYALRYAYEGEGVAVETRIVCNGVVLTNDEVRDGFVPKKKADREKAFLDDLTLLSIKYGVIVDGCGCCGSPFLSEPDEIKGVASYKEQSNGQLKWANW